VSFDPCLRVGLTSLHHSLHNGERIRGFDGPGERRPIVRSTRDGSFSRGQSLESVAEFLGACAKFEGFAQTVNDTQYLLPRMEHADLMRAIREPAPLYEGDISPDLAERLIADAGGSQDQLPLIQHALMFLHREFAAASGPWRMTLDHYQARGRLDKLLSEHADEVMSSVEPQAASAPTSRVTEDLFRALTDINADGQAIRRPQRLDDLIAVSGSDEPTVRRIIDAFRAEGVSFLRPYGDAPIALSDSIDISHEALIRCWQRLANPGLLVVEQVKLEVCPGDSLASQILR